MHPHGLMTDAQRQALLRKWLDTYTELLAKNPLTKVTEVDAIVGISNDSRVRWFREEWGQALLAEYNTAVDLESSSFLRLTRIEWLRNMANFATGHDKAARPMAQIQAATLLENAFREDRDRQQAEDQPAGKITAVLNLYMGTTTRQGAQEVEAEYKDVTPKAA